MHEVAHAWPQEPQCAAEELKSVSQPLAALASQLPHPEKQPIEHAPRLQPAVPWLLLQAWPHAPQLEVDVWVLVSHPLPSVPSQLP
jgi:hypothetical protein